MLAGCNRDGNLKVSRLKEQVTYHAQIDGSNGQEEE